jgi:ubiquinone/menaquinone biosynthesis C-methylase UbiE
VNTSPNAEHIQFWNDVLYRPFLRFRSLFTGMSDAHSRGPIERLGLASDARVLDVGCGFGETTLQLARLVPDGSVLGTDCCGPFLDIARDDARSAGVENVVFSEVDAQSEPFEPEFDVAFARFGTMFFQNPMAGMRNIRSALVPGGELLMVVWRPIEANQWVHLAKGVVQQYLPPPPDDAPTCGPGPFSMADPDVVRPILAKAGYEDITFEETTVVTRLGETLEESLAFQLAIGPAAEIFRDGGEDAKRLRPQIEAELSAVLAPYVREDGVYTETSSWAVHARRGGGVGPGGNGRA